MTDLFGANNNQPSSEDPIREAMNKMRLPGGGRDKYLQEGEGVYVLERLAFGMSPKNGAPQLTFALTCESHKDPTGKDRPDLVGKPFEHKLKTIGSGKRTLQMVLGDITAWLLFPFGKSAKAAALTDAIKDLIAKAYKENFATMVEKQELAPGKPFKGQRLKIRVSSTKQTVNDQQTGAPKEVTFTNAYPDVIDG